MGGLPSPAARFAHDANRCRTNVTDSMRPRQYSLFSTHVVGCHTCLGPWAGCRGGCLREVPQGLKVADASLGEIVWENNDNGFTQQKGVRL